MFKIKKLIINKEQEKRLIEIKRNIHINPELSFKEYQTTEYIKECLKDIKNVDIIDMPIETGVIAVINGSKEGKTVALRVDIDAISQDEKSNVKDKSQNKGLMHACGHDFHTASLIGSAMLLSENVSEIEGKIVLIFQPAEEVTNGAKYLIKKGLTDKYNIDYIFGLHNRPEIETGKIGLKQGGLMSAKDNFKIVINGKGGHGGVPQNCKDPIVCSAAIIQALQTIVSRNIDPFKTAVVSVCSIHGGVPENLIVDKIEMTGSIRTFDKEVRKKALDRSCEIVKSVSEAYECKGEFIVLESLDAVENSNEMYNFAKEVVTELYTENAIEEPQAAMASEDFSDYLKYAKGYFYWIGSRDKNEEYHSWHSDKFLTDDKAIKIASETLANSAFRILNNGDKK